jgi:predicted metalloprotease
MPSRLISIGAVMLSAGAIAACGSSSSSTSTATKSSTTATSSASTLKTVPVHGKTVTNRIVGVTGRQVNVTGVKHFKAIPRHNQHAHINGLNGLSVPQKLGALLNSVASLWQLEFKRANAQLPAASAYIVADTPVTCGSTQVTANSAPEYCPSSQTILFPLGTVTANIAPLGDAALLLLISDLYGYHVENAIGAFNHGYSGAQLEEMDSCFSGIYFYYAESNGYLQPTDEEGVNKLLALEAPAAGTGTSAGSVTAQDLAAAFNKGILSNLKPGVCIPS